MIENGSYTKYAILENGTIVIDTFGGLIAEEKDKLMHELRKLSLTSFVSVYFTSTQDLPDAKVFITEPRHRGTTSIQ